MISTALRGLTDRSSGGRLGLTAFEKAKMLCPGRVHENRQPLLVGPVQKPLRRQMVGAERVNGGGLHSAKVIIDQFGAWEWFTANGGGKWTVGHPLNAQPLSTPRKELAAHPPARLLGHHRTVVRCFCIED